VETEGSFLYSQKPTTGAYGEPDESNPHHRILFFDTCFIIKTPSHPDDGDSKYV
jgi:hypothetical protein